jgi:hypothetical protein
MEVCIPERVSLKVIAIVRNYTNGATGNCLGLYILKQPEAQGTLKDP